MLENVSNVVNLDIGQTLVLTTMAPAVVRQGQEVRPEVDVRQAAVEVVEGEGQEVSSQYQECGFIPRGQS